MPRRRPENGKGAQPITEAVIHPNTLKEASVECGPDGCPLDGSPGPYRRVFEEPPPVVHATPVPPGFNPQFGYLQRRAAMLAAERDPEPPKALQRVPSLPTVAAVQDWFQHHSVPNFVSRWWKTQATLGFPSRHSYKPEDAAFVEDLARSLISDPAWIEGWLPFLSNLDRPLSPGLAAQFILNEALHIGMVSAMSRYTTDTPVTPSRSHGAPELPPLVES